MFLSQDELHMLTGYHPQQYKKQVKWLSDHHYKFELDVRGRPRVLVSYIEAVLGIGAGKGRKKTEPDFTRFSKQAA